MTLLRIKRQNDVEPLAMQVNLSITPRKALRVRSACTCAISLALSHLRKYSLYDATQAECLSKKAVNSIMAWWMLMMVMLETVCSREA